MTSAPRLVGAIAALSALLAATGLAAAGGYVALSDDAEAVTQHHAVGAWQTFTGPLGFLPPQGWAVSGHAAVGSYGYDALSGGAGLSIQTAAFAPLTLGLAYAAFDADFDTRLLGASVSLPVGAATDVSLRLEGALTWQWDVNDDMPRALRLGDGPAPLALVDDISWWHGQAGVRVRAPWRVLRPTASLGLLVSRYAYEGRLCPGGDCFTPGAATADQGWLSQLAWDLGLEAQLGPLRPYLGVAAVADVAALVARLTIELD
jgi:hypothetical protein